MILLEAAVSTEWPKGAKWAASRDELIARAAEMLGADHTTEDVYLLRQSHRRAVKRLKKDSMALAPNLPLDP